MLDRGAANAGVVVSIADEIGNVRLRGPNSCRRMLRAWPQECEVFVDEIIVAIKQRVRGGTRFGGIVYELEVARAGTLCICAEV